MGHYAGELFEGEESDWQRARRLRREEDPEAAALYESLPNVESWDFKWVLCKELNRMQKELASVVQRIEQHSPKV